MTAARFRSDGQAAGDGACRSGTARQRLVTGSHAGRSGHQAKHLRWRPDRFGCLQGGVDGDKSIEAVVAQQPPDDLGCDHQPQIRPADNGPLVGADHGLGAGVITRDCRGHVCDQHGRAAVDDCQQLLANLAGVRQVNILRERHDRLLACPPHGVDVLKHGSSPSRRVGLGA